MVLLSGRWSPQDAALKDELWAQPVNDERAKCKAVEMWRRVSELNKVFPYAARKERTEREAGAAERVVWNKNNSDSAVRVCSGLSSVARCC